MAPKRRDFDGEDGAIVEVKRQKKEDALVTAKSIPQVNLICILMLDFIKFLPAISSLN